MNKSSTIIDGMYNEFIIYIIEDHVTIYNFTIRNSGGYIDNAGIKLNSENNLITECTIYRTKTGIYVNNTSNNEINNCTFHTNGEGIFLKSSSLNDIIDYSDGTHLRRDFDDWGNLDFNFFKNTHFEWPKR